MRCPRKCGGGLLEPQPIPRRSTAETLGDAFHDNYDSVKNISPDRTSERCPAAFPSEPIAGNAAGDASSAAVTSRTQ